MAKVYFKNEGSFVEATNIGKKENGQWTLSPVSQIYVKQSGSWATGVTATAITSCSFKGILATNTLLIGGAQSVSAESCQYVAIYNGNAVSSGATWSITSGGTYASIASNGTVTINSNANNSSVTIQVAYGELTTTKEVVLTYLSGSTSETETETIVNQQTGETITTTTTTTENQDGSSTEYTESVIVDNNGEVVGTTETTTETNSDGSYTGTTINYDANGEPLDATNVSGDVDGNVSTQEVEYDENGNSVVTGYTIDTSSSEDGEKNFNNNGVNTEYYALDVTQGFIMDIRFTIDFTQQPAGQNDNHHNIINSKRAMPEPWYGFQIRQTSTNKTVTLGTQFSTGSNTNTTVTTTNANKYNGSSNVYEYNFHIVYDPTAASDNFVCNELIGGFNYKQSNVFPDIEELKYIKTTIGCALDENGDPFRFSNINVFNFSLQKLRNVATPAISCDGMNVTLTCTTQGATIYYRLNQIGSYVAYSTPIAINADTVVQAYAELSGDRSNIATETCIYDNGMDVPVITCDGQYVTITCATVGATIKYRLNQTGSFSNYSSSIAINADTVVEAYSELNGLTSRTATENCLYDNGIATPVITCDGEYVTIMCDTPSVTIYYKLGSSGTYTQYLDSFAINATTVVYAKAELNGQYSHETNETCTYNPITLVAPVILFNGETITITCATQNATIMYKLDDGNYTTYSTPISILQNTLVQTYSTIHGRVSSIVSQNCEYSPVHHYENDYLTFKIRTAGKVYWRSNSLAKTIDYSLNNGTWTSITSATTPVSITVAANDVVRFRGSNATYATNKSTYSGFGHGEAGTSGQSTYDNDAADFDIEGNIMSLIYGDNFVGQTAFNGSTYNFCSLFKKAKCVSAENLVLPATTMTEACYRAMFSWCTYLEEAPSLPATTLAQYCYWYMFEKCAITTAPDLLFETFVANSCGSMFNGCASLNYIKCMANAGFNTTNCKQNWVSGVASSGTFVKDSGVTTSTWTTGANGIPTNWLVYDNVAVVPPTITYDGFSTITLSCDTQGATVYYKLNNTGNYVVYSTPLTISADTFIQTYSELNGSESRVISQTCVYVSDVPIEASNRDLKKWQYGGQEVTAPYSVNAVDGHSSSYAKGTFNFETSFALRQAQPAYLWFQHADHSASVYVDNTLVEKHWGGYTAFTVDISNYVHSGTNNIKITLKNNEGNYLAPAAGDFNFNATLGNVKLLTSPCLPAMNYGYDGFHVTSTVTTASATIYVKTTVPINSSVMCSISDGTYSWTDTQTSDGTEMTFSTTIANPHLWNGKTDPHLYTITMEISKDNVLYHRFVRPYGLRFYEYVINDITKVGTSANPYTGFLLNGSPYLLRGCCMHDDIEGKANALNETDYNNTFATIQELGLNFLRLAHYPHPKEVYDRCDQLGIVVQTEGPCVNKLQSTMPADYYTHLTTQYSDMVNQHYNHPCIMFWGLSNETTTDDKAFAKTKIEGYVSQIKALDSERMVGYVLAQSPGTSPSAYYNDPTGVDWFGCNIYVGWYDSPNSNTPTSQLNTRLNNTIGRVSKPMAYSEYGCGGTQHCHSEDFMTTTTRGNYERHDIEYMMWLHEGHIATIKQYPQLLFTSQWQLFDIAVSNRNEGYTVCLDGENTSTDDSLRRLNNKGLVERDHVTKKDPFYLYKAWWNPTPFVHICGKDYTKLASRVIKCYTNQTGTFTLKVNGTAVDTATPTDNILTFTARTFTAGDVISVELSASVNDTFTFAS